MSERILRKAGAGAPAATGSVRSLRFAAVGLLAGSLVGDRAGRAALAGAGGRPRHGLGRAGVRAGRAGARGARRPGCAAGRPARRPRPSMTITA